MSFLSSKPMISVCIMTYNHANYIEKAIESVLRQKTELTYEIIVSDDCSTDNTLDILHKYGDRIRIIEHDENVGISRNMYDIYKAAKGDFICSLGGDDWYILDSYIDDHFKYLCNHPECVAVTHLTRAYDEYEKPVQDIEFDDEMEDITDYLRCRKDANFHHGMIRNIFKKNNIEWLYKATRNTDEATYILYILMNGKWGVLHDYYYAYRTMRVNATNFNSMFNSIDNWSMHREAAEYILKNVTDKYVLKFRIRSYGALAIRTCYGDLIKRHNSKSLKKFRKMTTVGERFFYLWTCFLLVLGKGDYPYWYIKNKRLC